MAPIQRLKTNEIQFGQIINSDDINAELDQLINSANAQDTILSNLTTNAVTVSGVKSFSTGLKVDAVSEWSTDAGVTIEGVRLRDGALRPVAATAPVTPANGELWYNTTTEAYQSRLNGSNRVMVPAHRFWVSGAVPEYVSAGSIKLPQHLMMLDDTQQTLLEITNAGGLTLSLATTGAGGLDFGTEAANTWYYIWVCRGTSGTTAVLSTSLTSPVLPTGFTSYKRRYPYLAVRNDASSNLLRFRMNPMTKEVLYHTANWDTAGYSFMNNVTVSTTAAAYSIAAMVPPIAQFSKILMNAFSSATTLRLFVKDASLGVTTGDAQNVAWIRGTEAVVVTADVPLNTNRDVVIYADAASVAVSAGVIGWSALGEETL
jgi:hypothetical protein